MEIKEGYLLMNVSQRTLKLKFVYPSFQFKLYLDVNDILLDHGTLQPFRAGYFHKITIF